jgi:hypothetical protein
MVDNYSEDPVSNVALVGKITFTDGRSFPVTILLGEVPTCSIGRITDSMIANYFKGTAFIQFSSLSSLSSATPGTVAAGGSRDIPNNNYRFAAESLYFTDNSGIDWQYPAGGPLETAKLPLSNPASIGIFVIITPFENGATKAENKDLTPSYGQVTSCT